MDCMTPDIYWSPLVYLSGKIQVGAAPNWLYREWESLVHSPLWILHIYSAYQTSSGNTPGQEQQKEHQCSDPPHSSWLSRPQPRPRSSARAASAAGRWRTAWGYRWDTPTRILLTTKTGERYLLCFVFQDESDWRDWGREVRVSLGRLHPDQDQEGAGLQVRGDTDKRQVRVDSAWDSGQLEKFCEGLWWRLLTASRIRGSL